MARHPLSAYRLWLFVGTASLLLSVPAEAATAFDRDGWGTRPDPDRSAPIYLMAQFHEPQPPVVPFVAPPVTPPVPPKVFAPLPLPPDSQAIKSSPPKTKTPSAPTTASKPAAAADPAVAARQAEAAERREHARNLQSVLTDMGYDPGPADGIVGSKTMDALFSWIASISDPDLQEHARHAAHADDYLKLKEIADTVMATEAGSGSVAAEPAPPAQSPDTKMAAVSSVQEKLADIGHDPGPADGFAGDHTVGAINRWIDGIQSDSQRELARLALDGGNYELLDVLMSRHDPEDHPSSVDVLAESIQPVMHTLDLPADGEPEQLLAISEAFLKLKPVVNYAGLAFPVQYSPALGPDQSFYGGGLTAVEFIDGHIARAEAYLRRAAQDYDANVKALSDMQQLYLDYKYEQLLDTQKSIQQTIKDYEAWIASPQQSWKSDERYAAERAELQAAQSRIIESKMVIMSSLAAELASLSEFEKTSGYVSLKDNILDSKTKLIALQRDVAIMEIRKADILVAQANVDAYHNNDTAGMLDIAETHAQRVAAAEDDLGVSLSATPEQIARTQSEIDSLIESGQQAGAELKSLEARTDISAEQKAALRDGIQSRVAATDMFLEEAQLKLAAEGGTFDGYDGKDFAEFDPYAITQTDVELYKIAEEAKAAEQFYDELSRARDAINQTTDGLDAASLHEKVTALSERVTEGAESYQEVADLLHEYGTNIQVTRKQGALEYAQAMAEDAVLESERNLAYAQSVVNTSKNSVALLALGGMGYAAATSGFAAMGVVGLQSQAVMATLDGASSAIDGFDRGGAEEALKQGLLQGGKYYLPINTGMALTNKNATKTEVALGVLSDAANLYAGYQSLKSLAGKAAAAQARITEMTLSKSDQAISQAAKAAQQNGDDLVRSYQNAKFEVELAMRSGMGAEVSKAQDKLQQIVRAIDVSDEAKLALKTRGVLVQAEFVGDQAQFIKQPAQDIWKQKMQDMGWTDAGLDTGQIRNQSSAGTVGLDDDIRLLEPSLIDRLDDGTPKYSGPSDPNFVSDTNAFRQKLTKGGEVQSLTTWERDAQQAMEEAYQEVAGYSAKNNARVEMTTSLSDEAFKDVRVLQEGGTNQTSAGWAEQSASVTQTKMREGIAHANGLGLGDGPATASLSGTALQEATTEIKVATRELLKDLTGKALKAQPGFEMPAKIDRQIKILQGVVDGTYDPAVANALLKAQTDTSLAKTMESLGGHFEAILKFH